MEVFLQAIYRLFGINPSGPVYAHTRGIVSVIITNGLNYSGPQTLHDFSVGLKIYMLRCDMGFFEQWKECPALDLI